MPDTHGKIKQIESFLAVGLSVSESIARALGTSLTAFARANGWEQPQVSMCLNAYRPYPEIRDAVCRELHIPREYLDRLIDGQREPVGEKSA